MGGVVRCFAGADCSAARSDTGLFDRAAAAEDCPKVDRRVTDRVAKALVGRMLVEGLLQWLYALWHGQLAQRGKANSGSGQAR